MMTKHFTSEHFIHERILVGEVEVDKELPTFDSVCAAIEELAENAAVQWVEAWFSKYCKIFIVPIGKEVGMNYESLRRAMRDATTRGGVK